jgi:hypothetical protein
MTDDRRPIRPTAEAIRQNRDAFEDACHLLGASHQTVSARKEALKVRDAYRLQAPIDVGLLLAELAAADALIDQLLRESDPTAI